MNPAVPMRHPLIRLASLALALALTGRPAGAVAVSPNALYIDGRTRSGLLTLVNTGSAAEEIEIGFAFGYPRSDSAGVVSVELVSSAPAGEPSAVPWLRAFPRRLRLAPGQRQVVRVLVQPGAAPTDGEYWGRMTITSRGGEPPITQQEGRVSFSVAVQTVIVAAVNFRQGKVTTGVAVEQATASVADSAVRLTLDLARQGNAAFLGRVTAQLLDRAGRPQGTPVAEDVAVYRSLRRVVVLPVPAGASLAGYAVRYAFDTVRPDLPPDAPLVARPVTGTVPIALGAR